uniref:Uncharacterized protein n=1 Tax=Brassica oleracea TaxID=3712 RepID=A0A3P6CXC8_BRAOL|nr:unnamed protein product [Brassica oleracea]
MVSLGHGRTMWLLHYYVLGSDTTKISLKKVTSLNEDYHILNRN